MKSLAAFALVLAVLLSVFAALIDRRLAWLPAVIVLSYSVMALAASGHILLTRSGVKGGAYLPLLFGVFHGAYGVGVLAGFFSSIGKPPRQNIGPVTATTLPVTAGGVCRDEIA